MEDFQGFKAELLRQYGKRCQLLKRQVDEEIADTIMERRIAIEKTVHGLRTAHKKKLDMGLSANRRRAELHRSACFDAIRSAVVSRLEEKLAARVADLRRSEWYAPLMRALALEAGAVFQAPAVALVEPGDAIHLTTCPAIREVREELNDVWGGLVLFDDRGRRVDNTLRTRWEALRLQAVRAVERRMNPQEGL